ncbi:SRPBCC family protein [Cohnella sp.]|uniref:SRPBCC family protein n=1 Tax=Cohnella sp. TaxID=1883426 RepID=UPI003564B788
MRANNPAVTAEMLIRKPVEAVYEAFVDPAVTTKFWFTKSSGRLEQGARVRWDWEMYGVGDDIYVRKLEPNRRLEIEFSDGTAAEWTFTEREDGTFVSIVNYGFAGSEEEQAAQAVDAMGGYTMVLCALKALLEHDVRLNVVADKAPDANIH